jgi:hypothetical protein
MQVWRPTDMLTRSEQTVLEELAAFLAQPKDQSDALG